MESKKTNHPQLLYEAKLYNSLQGGSGISDIKWCGSDGANNILVMDLLGPSIVGLFVYCGRKFSLKIVLMLADQMFLPQDRVCEFGKLTPVQLLEETEKAVGDLELPTQHHTLVEKSHALKHIMLTVEKKEGTLNQLKERNAEVEKDVERVRQREELLHKVELMKKKLPWLRYDMKKAEYLETKKKEKDAAKKLEEAAKILNDLKEPIGNQKKEKASLDAKCRNINHLPSDYTNKRMELLRLEN